MYGTLPLVCVQFIENFGGYWTGSYYGPWISRFPIENSASELQRFATDQWMQSVFHELSKEIGFNSMDQKYWKAVAWKVSGTLWFSVRCIENFRKESYCPKSFPRCFPRKFVPNVNLKPCVLILDTDLSVSRKVSFLEMKRTLVNWKRLFGPKFLSKSWINSLTMNVQTVILIISHSISHFVGNFSLISKAMNEKDTNNIYQNVILSPLCPYV